MPAARSAGRRPDLLALIVYCGLGCLLFLPALRAPQTRIIGFNGDAQQTMWFLRWTPWAVSHGVDPLLTGYINHPSGVNLMWNSLAPVLGIALWPVSATAGLVVAYNLLLAGEVVLSAWCAYLAIRRLVGHSLGAALGGLMYGFSPYLLSHAHGHAKITFALLPPLLLLALHEILVTQRRRPHTAGVALGALLTVQLHGIAYKPELAVAPDRLDFGDVDVGAQKTLTFEVTNSSPVALGMFTTSQHMATISSSRISARIVLARSSLMEP